MSISLALTIAGLCTISGIAGYALARNGVAKRKAELDHLLAMLRSMSRTDAETSARSLEGQ